MIGAPPGAAGSLVERNSMGRFEREPGVETWFEVDCEACGVARWRKTKQEAFEAAREHPEDCQRPTWVDIVQKGRTEPGKPYSWRVLLNE